MTPRSVKFPTDAATSARMRVIRQTNTAPEQAVREILHSLGYRYRLWNNDLPGTPDIANRCKKWVLFVHGCFWHHHQGCKLATVPKRNRKAWISKLRNNQDRDARSERELRSAGYHVIVVWECETRGFY